MGTVTKGTVDRFTFGSFSANLYDSLILPFPLHLPLPSLLLPPSFSSQPLPFACVLCQGQEGASKRELSVLHP